MLGILHLLYGRPRLLASQVNLSGAKNSIRHRVANLAPQTTILDRVGTSYSTSRGLGQPQFAIRHAHLACSGRCSSKQPTYLHNSENRVNVNGVHSHPGLVNRIALATIKLSLHLDATLAYILTPAKNHCFPSSRNLHILVQ